MLGSRVLPATRVGTKVEQIDVDGPKSGPTDTWAAKSMAG